MIKEEVALPNKVAIAGVSYGGYAAALALGKAPERFACGAALSAPLRLETLMAALPAQWAALVESMASRIGDHRTQEGRALLKEQSPATWLSRRRSPLLLIHGDRDPRAPVREVRQLLDESPPAAPLTWLTFEGEGHLLRHRANRMTAYAATEVFLHQCLGGRLQPPGDDLWGAAPRPMTGLEHLPALERALQDQGEPSVK
jgi:dipeptidyl aminopeptidase/acylaminoacyl peptidase